ncbi:MAG: phosphoribosylanthranilate isomerase [Beijerinckiaceae bacterium]
MLTVKICGLSDAAGLDAALSAGADMAGFVFFEASPRHVALDRAQALGARVAGRARKVALTVDADDAGLAAVIESLAPDMLQLHGQETPERVSYVRARFGLPVMRAIRVASAGDLIEAARFDVVADYLLFDARAPGDAVLPGGNGVAFDWRLLRGLQIRKPWLLAGGLNCKNVAQALAETGARGVDVSSGVETSPGVKSPEKIARFVALARKAGEELGSIPAIG